MQAGLIAAGDTRSKQAHGTALEYDSLYTITSQCVDVELKAGTAEAQRLTNADQILSAGFGRYQKGFFPPFTNRQKSLVRSLPRSKIF
ncbi:hypothetical protein PkP19E3_33870 (plasmid) [Pseudomonas koreensis]|nr:hypothetical protein PkP19E3_33870 [Pseudomonas koreensis]